MKSRRRRRLPTVTQRKEKEEKIKHHQVGNFRTN